MSPPTRGRGSKRIWPHHQRERCEVAPYAGAWIETVWILSITPWPKCRPLRGGVDRNSARTGRGSPGLPSPPTRGRGSKLREDGTWVTGFAVAPYAGAWIETLHERCEGGDLWSRPLRGGVDRNKRAEQRVDSAMMSPPTRGRGSKPTRRVAVPMTGRSPPTRGRGSKHGGGYPGGHI